MRTSYVQTTGAARDDLRADAVRMYNEGLSIREVSRWLNRSYGCTHRLLVEAGVTLRPRGYRGRRDAA